jgi:hypothetical protein
MTPSLPPAVLVARAGETLYGDKWAGPLARVLGVKERTTRRVKAAAIIGDPYPVAPEVLDDLKAVLLGRSADMQRLAREIP